LKPVQLLWVNLIMDTMAALALATDSPTPELLDRRPYGKDDALITRSMWVHIIGQALFQLTISLTNLYCGASIFGVEHDSVLHRTLIFNIFVMCQLFNEINCRRLGSDFNIFRGFFTNQICLAVMGFTIVVQWLIIEFGGEFASTVPLSLNQWLISIGIGFMSIPVSLVLRCIPITEPVEERQRKTPSVAQMKRMESIKNWGKLRNAISAASTLKQLQKDKKPLTDSFRRHRRIATPGFSPGDKA